MVKMNCLSNAYLIQRKMPRRAAKTHRIFQKHEFLPEVHLPRNTLVSEPNTKTHIGEHAVKGNLAILYPEN
jgi:hypothetical protein